MLAREFSILIITAFTSSFIRESVAYPVHLVSGGIFKISNNCEDKNLSR